MNMNQNMNPTPVLQQGRNAQLLLHLISERHQKLDIHDHPKHILKLCPAQVLTGKWPGLGSWDHCAWNVSDGTLPFVISGNWIKHEDCCDTSSCFLCPPTSNGDAALVCSLTEMQPTDKTQPSLLCSSLMQVTLSYGICDDIPQQAYKCGAACSL